MRIEQLEYFLTIARYGSLSKAASNIYVGQPTLSASIAGLEKELGQSLFHRTRRGMELTAMGQELLPMIEKTVDDFYAIKKRAGIDNPSDVHVHLVSAQASSSVMVETVFRTREIFPRAHYFLHHQYSSEVLLDLLRQKAVIGLSVAPEADLARHREYAASANLRLMPLYNDNLCLFCRSDGRYRDTHTLSFETLSAENNVVMPTDLIHQGGIKSQNTWLGFPSNVTADDLYTMQRFVYRDDLLGCTTLLQAQEERTFQSELFKIISLTDCAVNVVHYLSYSRDHTISDVEADIIQQIEQVYQHIDLLQSGNDIHG